MKKINYIDYPFYFGMFFRHNIHGVHVLAKVLLDVNKKRKVYAVLLNISTGMPWTCAVPMTDPEFTRISRREFVELCGSAGSEFTHIERPRI